MNFELNNISTNILNQSNIILNDTNNIINHNDIDKIIKNSLTEINKDYDFNIDDDTIVLNISNYGENKEHDLNIVKNIMAYLYYKQLNGELNNNNNIMGEFILQENINNKEKYDYFPNCKLINKLVNKPEKIKKDDDLLKNNEICFICFEQYKEKEFKRKLPHCGHYFHKKCIDKWLKNKSTCPHCRCDLMEHINLSDEDEKEYYKKCCNCDCDEIDNFEEIVFRFSLS